MSKLVFLTYLNRSGSTYLCQQLSAYHDIMVVPEAEVLLYKFLRAPGRVITIDEGFTKSIQDIFRNDPKVKYWKLNPEHVVSSFEGQTNFDFFKWILEKYRDTYKPEATTILFKGTRLINILPYLLECNSMSGVMILSLMRDPRSVYYSQSRTRNPINHKVMCTNPVVLFKHWDWYVNQLDRFQNAIPMLVVRYEEVITMPTEAIQKIVHYLQLASHKTTAEGDLYERIPKNQKAIHQKAIQAPKKMCIEQWREEVSANSIWIRIIQSGSKHMHKYYASHTIRTTNSVLMVGYKFYYYAAFLLYKHGYKYAYHKS